MYYVLDDGVIIDGEGKVVMVGQDGGLRDLLEDGGMPEPVTQFDVLFGEGNWGFKGGTLNVYQHGIAKILDGL
jgi:hypothetical protein